MAAKNAEDQPAGQSELAAERTQQTAEHGAPDLPETASGQEPGQFTAEDQARLSELQARAAAAQGLAAGQVPDATVRVKIEEPHSLFTYGGVSVGREYTEVPARHLAALMGAAAEAGVTLTQEG